MSDPATLIRRFYPEAAFGGFSRISSSIQFFTRVSALVGPGDRVLDYGAGRGAHIANDRTRYGRWLKTLKGRVAHVSGCDVDPVVLENPYVDDAAIIAIGQPLPYPDASFDLVFCSWVFQHVERPEEVASELLRVVKPGGYICAMTPNRFGYVAMASSVIANAQHTKALRHIQPSRKAFDTFPTFYRLNTRKAIRRYFGKEAQIAVYGTSSEPSYHFNNTAVYAAFKLIHALTPSFLHTTLLIFVRKNGGDQDERAEA